MRYVVVFAVAVVAVLLGVTFARALPAVVEREKVGRDNAVKAVCDQTLRPEASAPALGGPLPQPSLDFTLKDYAGRDVSLSSLKGRVVLLNFWATWCPTCVIEMPSLERLQSLEKGKPFSLVAVSVDEKWDEVRRFFRTGTQMTVLLDAERKMPARYGTEKFPETFLIDKEGNVRFYVISDRDWSSPGMRACIESLIDA